MRPARSGARAWRAAPIAMSLTLLISGCGLFGGGGSGATAGGATITVAVVPGIENAPLDVALQQGLFQQHGLNVNVKSYTSLSDEFQALTGGQAQIAAGDYTDFLYKESAYEQANGGRALLRLVADGYDAAANSVAILTMPNSKLTTPEQLEGQAVATVPAQLAPGKAPGTNAAVPYSIQTLAAQEVLQSKGVSPSGITWSQMPPQDMIGALHSGEVAAILVSEPYILQAEQQVGAVELLDASTGLTAGLPMSGYFSKGSYAQANPSVVQAFQQALNQAQTMCAQRGPAQGVLSHLTDWTTGDAALVTLGTYPTSLNTAQVQQVATLMYESGMISNQVNVNRLTS